MGRHFRYDGGPEGVLVVVSVLVVSAGLVT
jgi:hypothetical protein